MSTPLVSIIIPCYNGSRWLTETLDSALSQTWPEKEVIFIDDGSTDDSLTIARGYESQGLKIWAQPNQGAAAARNAGLKAARGEYIQFLDSDDVLAPDKIEIQVRALQKSNPDCIASCPWGEFQVHTAEATFTRQPIWGSFAPVDWLICSWEGGGMMHPGAWLAPRKLLEAAGPWNAALSLDDDGEYFSRVILRSSGVVFVPDAKSYYRSHGGVRLSGSAGPKAALSSFTACTLKEEHLLAVENSERTRHALACNYARLAWEQCTIAPKLVKQAMKRWRALDPTVKVPKAGRLFNFLSSWVGWRNARRIDLFVRRLLLQ